MNLPKGFRPFTKEDWYGFAGASRWSDGTAPVFGFLPVIVANRNVDAAVVISADENGMSDKALIGVMTFEDEDGGEDCTWHTTRATLSAALRLVEVLLSTQLPLTPQTLTEVFGFERII